MLDVVRRCGAIGSRNIRNAQPPRADPPTLACPTRFEKQPLASPKRAPAELFGGSRPAASKSTLMNDAVIGSSGRVGETQPPHLALGGVRQARGQAQEAQGPDGVPCEVDLPPLQPVSARVLKSVVVVVPPLTECQQADEPIVHGVVLGVPILEAPDMGHGVDHPRDVPDPDHAEEEAPHDEGQPSEGVHGDNRYHDAVQGVGFRQHAVVPLLLQVIGVCLVLAHPGALSVQEPAHVRPPEAVERRVHVALSLGASVVVTVRGHPIEPAHVRPPEAVERRVHVVLSLGASVVVTVRRHPIDRVALQSHDAAVGEHIFQELRGLEGAVRQLPVVGQGDAEHARDEVHHEKAAEGGPREEPRGGEGAGVDDNEEDRVANVLRDPLPSEVRAGVHDVVPELAVAAAEEPLPRASKGQRLPRLGALRTLDRPLRRLKRNALRDTAAAKRAAAARAAGATAEEVLAAPVPAPPAAPPPAREGCDGRPQTRPPVPGEDSGGAANDLEVPA
eukprot:CAMPEP_0183599424 /NCGR_PEP_ID=MMETSP0371-20130417/179427_1 /TAXON_ID=268820 /ORGANISM="Peridinium aciculiferum, Strain PAER-2" /LENGTH=503 /DNA_ID=CAMNT_0025811491 /DNA_START=779 /DNA_END=2292 /DNA_ORIENTATION=+